MKKIRLATIGIGRFGINHLHAFKQLEKYQNIELVAACELDINKHQFIKSKFDILIYENFEEMIDELDLDAVSVATQDHLHKEIVIHALSKGLHVLVEKPMDVSSIGSAEMVDLAERNNLLLQVDFHKRYDPYHIEIKQLLDSGKFGELLYGYCYMEDQIVVPRDWFKDWVHHTSPLLFLGVNFIDLISWFLNSKVECVYAKGHQKKLKSLGYNTYDSVQAMICFDNNAVITFDNSWILPEQFSSIANQGFRLIGTEGIVEADSHNRGTTSCFSNENGIRNHNSGFIYPIKLTNDEQIYAGYGIQSIQHFAENISYLKNGGSLVNLEGTYPSGKDGHQVNEIIDAIEISLKSGEKVSLNQNTNRILENAK